MDLEPSMPQENPQDEIPAEGKRVSRKAIFAAGLFAAVASILFLTFGSGGGQKAAPVSDTYATARAQFVDFRTPREMPPNGVIHFVPTGDNRTYDKIDVFLKDERGRPTIINMWATWCRPCRAELVALDKLHDGLIAAGANVVPVLTADRSGVGGAKYFYKGADIVKLPYFLDHDREFLDALGMRSLPVMLLASPEGKLIAYALGPNLDSPNVQDILFAFAKTGKLPD